MQKYELKTYLSFKESSLDEVSSWYWRLNLQKTTQVAQEKRKKWFLHSFFYKNLFHKNIEAENCKILRINSKTKPKAEI